METGPPRSALVKVAAPAALPVAEGAKLAVNVALFPGFKLTGRGTPASVKPAPEATACEIVSVAPPEFVTVRLWFAVEPTATFPKLTEAGEALSAAGVVCAVVVALVEAVVFVELPLAAVTPAQPERIAAESSSVPEMKRTMMRDRRQAHEEFERKSQP